MNDRQSQHPSFDLDESDMVFFEKIPPQFLKPILLLHHEKMNYAEIAQQTELPIGTVKSRIFRGREMIRRLREQDVAQQETFQKPRMTA